MQSLLKNKKVLYGAVLALVGIISIGLVVSKNREGSDEIFSVARRDVIEKVILSGTVEADIVSDLGFEASGVVRDVFVSVNDVVSQGATLARLGLGTLQAELQSAQASVLIKQAEVANTTVTLDTVIQKQDTLVANALSELLSDDLIAEPQSASADQTAPLITGRYSGKPGTYKIRVEPSIQQTKDTLRVFDLETTGAVEINKTGPTPLGTKGLFISFPDAISSYRDTTWYITIPNEKGASYTANYSAYQTALRERQRAIEDAEAELRAQEAGSSIAEAELAQARAEVSRIQSQIRERTLVAPFNGIVTAVHIDPGESASVGVPAISLISQGGFGVEIDLPEIDSVKVKMGDKASVALDAFGDETIFSATVVSVNRTETIVDSVAVYEARIAFDVQDERVASGMTAEVIITTDERTNVLAIPARAVRYHEDGTPFVSVTVAGTEKVQDVDVVLGLRGSDGFFEVLQGLSEGDQVHISS